MNDKDVLSIVPSIAGGLASLQTGAHSTRCILRCTCS